MRTMSIDELKDSQLRILQAVDLFCRDHSIKYWIDYGTLLGAIRHKGYIPWDDDIDIGMLREDWLKFSEIFIISQSKYLLRFASIDPQYPWGFGKIIDPDTILYEPDEKGYKGSVNIDVFIYDNASEDKSQLYKQYKRCQLYKVLHTQRLNTFIPRGSCIRRATIFGLRLLLKAFKTDFFWHQFEKESQKSNDLYCKDVIVFSSGRKKPQTYKMEWFSSTIDILFEGLTFQGPKGWDELLKAEYGNYMELPPIEKQVSHHHFVGYFLEEGDK